MILPIAEIILSVVISVSELNPNPSNEAKIRQVVVVARLQNGVS